MGSNVAQLFSELYCKHPFVGWFLAQAGTAAAWQMNHAAGFGSLVVYGLLTDLGSFHFFSFDPVTTTFYRDGKIMVNQKRGDFLHDMMEGAFLHGVCCCAHSVSFLPSCR